LRSNYGPTAGATDMARRLTGLGVPDVSHLICVLPRFLLCIPSISCRTTLVPRLPCTVAAR